MKSKFLSPVFLAAAGIISLAAAANAGEVNTGYFGDVAIKGYDPVAYFTDHKAIQGSETISYDWLGATWRFSSDEHRRLFSTSSYAPQYGGACAPKALPRTARRRSTSTPRAGRSSTASSTLARGPISRTARLMSPRPKKTGLPPTPN